ncbi:MAG: phosphoribosylanthranilate isomerase [Legionellaceae bacterium]|nr:phosphoribosylanthranilate isomerase [Legionellaceae bacterium]
MQTKICGITNLQDALLAVKAGAWGLGFNFYKGSPRYVTFEKAAKMIQALPKHIVTVGVFLEESSEEIKSIMDAIGLQLAQIYQDFDAPDTVKQQRIYCIQPGSMGDVPDASCLRPYAYVLVDAPRVTVNDAYGGTGKPANWAIAKALANENHLILAGGLTAQNVAYGMGVVQPDVVDVASGVEKAVGMKDAHLMQQFIKEVRDAS